ncbi:MAG: hypothetical protein JSR74_02090, partial [Proteobacteria bacterium]|nr:hypothetical protein [Pseudomonadota bacterium]
MPLFTCCCPPWFTFGCQHLHQLASAQHQGLQLLQFGISQRLDEAFALRVLVQHA